LSSASDFRLPPELKLFLPKDIASKRALAQRDDCGFASEVGNLADVDASQEEWALVMQSTESYERFIRHAVEEACKARRLRREQRREERRRLEEAERKPRRPRGRRRRRDGGRVGEDRLEGGGRGRRGRRPGGQGTLVRTHFFLMPF
jgi:hypothetical protein